MLPRSVPASGPSAVPTTLNETRLTELRDEELAWLAALATSARGLQPSLRDFLR